MWNLFVGKELLIFILLRLVNNWYFHVSIFQHKKYNNDYIDFMLCLWIHNLCPCFYICFFENCFLKNVFHVSFVKFHLCLILSAEHVALLFYYYYYYIFFKWVLLLINDMRSNKHTKIKVLIMIKIIFEKLFRIYNK